MGRAGVVVAGAALGIGTATFAALKAQAAMVGPAAVGLSL